MGSKHLHNKNNNSNSIKFLCSYGGKILPRRTDGILRYYGGHTRVLALHPSASFSELMIKISELCRSPAILRCLLPNGDLDTLISVKNDEDLLNIIEEYDRASSSLPHRLKIRAILSPQNKSSSPSSSTTASRTPSGSPPSSADSPPCYEAHRFGCRDCSLDAYSIGFRNGAAKSGSPPSSAGSPPCYEAHRFGCRDCSPDAYSIGFRKGAAKSGSPHFWLGPLPCSATRRFDCRNCSSAAHFIGVHNGAAKFDSPHSYGGYPPYSAAHRFGCQNCSPVQYPVGVSNKAVKGY